jgi:osmoprotectant transport system substrate-binding protein
MDRTKTVAGLIALAAMAGCSPGGPALRVGSKNFTEQVLLGEIVAQQVERRLHVRVERRLNLGGTLLAHQALAAGGIDLYPEYSGTAASVVLNENAGGDAEEVRERVRAEYRRRFQVEWLPPLGVNNTFAMIVRGARARAGNLRTLSDAAHAAEPWVLGVGYEFEQRADGLPALRSAYGLRLAGSAKTMDLGLLYRALEQDQVTMIAANSTDGLLSSLDLTVLEDDRRAFPPYEASLAVRAQALERFPGLRQALEELSGKFDNRAMQRLNYQVDGLHRPASEVAAEFLAGW